MTTPTVLKWFGGKSYLAPEIIKLAQRTKYVHYVESFFGGGSVLLAMDPDNVSEVVNDVDWDLINFWSVLRSEEMFPQFQRAMQAMPFCEGEWQVAREAVKHEFPAVQHAINFFVFCRQSMGGKMKNFAPLSRNRVRRGMNEQASAWLTCIEGLPEVHARLRSVAILNREGVEAIRTQDGKQTMHYCDPPYMHDTRTGTDDYSHEMSREEHVALLDTLSAVEGRFMLSGYENELYADYAKQNRWNVHRFDLPNNAAGGKSKRRMTECIWCNF
jgi:DNA adenine methylase